MIPEIAAYRKEFAKTKLLNPEFHRLLLEAQDKRNIGDYGMIGGIEDNDAQEIMDWSKKFLKAAEKYFKQVF